MNILYTILLVFIASVASAHDLDTLESIFQSNRITEIPQIASNLSARGSILQSKGMYKEALELYEQSLSLREKIGTQNTQSYATILFLSSIVEHKSGESCKAMKRIEKVIEIYKNLGKQNESNIAEEEGFKVYQKACSSILVTRN